MRAAELVQADREAPGHLQRVPAGPSRAPRPARPPRRTARGTPPRRARRDGDQRPRRRLAEQAGERVARAASPGARRPPLARQALGQRDGQAAVGQVVGARPAARARPRVTSTSARARSAARSTAGGAPPRCPCATRAHSEPPSSGRVAPSSSSVAAGLGRSPTAPARRTSSCTPSTPTTGVGWMAAVAVWL